MSGDKQSAGSPKPGNSGVSLFMFYGTRHEEPQARPASSNVIVESDDDSYDTESDSSVDDNMSDLEWLPDVSEVQKKRSSDDSEKYVRIVMQVGDPMPVSMCGEERRPIEEGSEGTKLTTLCLIMDHGTLPAHYLSSLVRSGRHRM